MKIKAQSAAKINLALNIKGKRKDNYHEVDMIMQSIGLYDTISVEENTKTLNIQVTCNKNIDCKIEENTAHKACLEFLKYTKISCGVSVEIEKKIPIKAGLAGGSSNAAAVIISLNEIFKTKLSMSEMEYIASKVGADVVFCLSGGTKRAKGIGTDLSCVSSLPDCFVVLVKPDFDISTKNAYSLYHTFGMKSEKNTETMVELLEKEDLKSISRYLFNDFECLAQNKIVDNIKKKLLGSGALGACMSGSGPTVYGVFSDELFAENSKRQLEGEFEDVYVVKPISFGVKIF